MTSNPANLQLQDDHSHDKPWANHQESVCGADLEDPQNEKKAAPQSETADWTGSQKKSDPAEIRLVRKIDFVMMPVLWIMYWFNYLDRNAITVARLDNLEAELGLSSTQYQTCVSILFVGYILGQVPSSMSCPQLYPQTPPYIYGYTKHLPEKTCSSPASGPPFSCPAQCASGPL